MTGTADEATIEIAENGRLSSFQRVRHSESRSDGNARRSD